MSHPSTTRNLGLWGATGVGVGAIVGGGILALAGVAFAATGPSALLAFALNGLIAVLTALSFAEMSASFPESGGTYTFAKKVLSVEAAFMVGWVVWFASIVAAVLYALGFAAYAAIVLQEIATLVGGAAPEWLGGRLAVLALALGATLFYTVSLMRSADGGGQWATVGKVVVFVVLILGGIWAFGGRPLLPTLHDGLTPFFPFGATGLFQAMGYTFIALQGFDLIAAVGGEVKDPGRNLPRSMLLSLGAALAIYLPLLLIITTVGRPEGASITEWSAAHPETLVALAARHYLGTFGYWLVLVAAVLSMLSALQANLLAASRIALAMARDRTLPKRLGDLDARRGTPANAVLLTAGTVAVTLLVIPDVAAAGAVSSLIFLISFALAHGTNILTRLRGGAAEAPFRLPFFPAIPLLGALFCTLLALFQGFAVPISGAIAALWLILGGGLYFALFASRARVVDAAAEARDPDLVRLRGRSPLVLVPIANPQSAASLVEAAHALAAPKVGRVLMLSVVRRPDEWTPGEPPRELIDAQSVLGESLTVAFAQSLAPQALITVANRPWREIERVARAHRCESLLLGSSKLDAEWVGGPLEDLMSRSDADVVLLRAEPGFQISAARRILIPIGGRRDHSPLRARLIGSLCRGAPREITYLGVFSHDTDESVVQSAREDFTLLAQDEAPPGFGEVEIERGDLPLAEELARRATDCDLLVMGLRRLGRRRRVFGELTLEVARRTSCPILMISQGA